MVVRSDYYGSLFHGATTSVSPFGADIMTAAIANDILPRRTVIISFNSVCDCEVPFPTKEFSNLKVDAKAKGLTSKLIESSQNH